MNKICWFVVFMMCCCILNAQTVEQKLLRAVQQLEADSQMRHAILGFAVADAKTGKVLFERNSQIGLATASTQKIFTSIASFDLLGKNYRYKTEFGYNGELKDGRVQGVLFVKPHGDPTFGSWRFPSTKPEAIKAQLLAALKQQGIKTSNFIVVKDDIFDVKFIPDGWIWQDMGNYYGAGSGALNWRENQYDLSMDAGDKPGDPVRLHPINIIDFITNDGIINELTTGPKGSGDNAYIYSPPYSSLMFLKGTIPAGEKKFTISGSIPMPAKTFGFEMRSWLDGPPDKTTVASVIYNKFYGSPPAPYSDPKTIFTYVSPPLDSINYYFMRRSINLYGEALIKTISYEQTGYGSTDTGVNIVRDFWASKGIEKSALNIIDGSGLSPQNRITADALVKALLYAKQREWYASFYESLPLYNGMKLKSGSIGGARSFAGYHTAANGKQYVTAIIVNNYAGSSGGIVKKLFKVLDELK